MKLTNKDPTSILPTDKLINKNNLTVSQEEAQNCNVNSQRSN